MSYSPKIDKKLVAKLYQLKQSRQKKAPLTHLVKEAIIQYLERQESLLKISEGESNGRIE